MVDPRRAARLLTALATLSLGVLVGQGCSGSSDSGPGADAGVDATDEDPTKAACGDGVVTPPEQCDDANKANGDGCDNDCTFSCNAAEARGLSKCDANPCKGALSCSAAHVCTYGAPVTDGGGCGGGKVCKGGSCVPPQCGDGIVETGEECDDGNAIKGDGCEPDCTFTCLTSDPARNCTPKDTCAGKGTCSDATHICAPGTPLGNGTACGAGGTQVCKGGVCIAPSCGDGILEAGEECDFGTGNGLGTGCESNCKFSCKKTPTDSCVTVDACAGTNACTTVTVGGASGQKCVTGTPPPDGTTCPNGGKCMGGLCKTANCGNGVIDPGEQCDFGAGNGAGTGCELNCKFSCQTTPTDTCPSADPCSASPNKCAPVTVGGKAGQKCQPITQIASCAACGGGNICFGGVCTPSRCGDACVVPPETCDPPNGTTCSATCTKIVCGDGKREGQEQCDDGQTPPLNLDGCDATCNFEQNHRATAVAMTFSPSTLCGTGNALGGAIASPAQGTLLTSLSNGVKDGSTTIIFKFFGLTDLSGTSQAQLQMGGLGGTPVAGAGYDGTKDVDWWYTTSASSIDAARNPKTYLTGSIAAKALTAAGTIDLGINLAGGPAVLHMSSAKLKATVGASSTPLASSGATPGHLASENLDPAIMSFVQTSAGQLCGNVSCASLATVPVPAALVTGGSNACSQGYTSANHLLDVLVHGCNVIFGITAITPTQPDQVDPAMPAAGAGAPYNLTVTGNTVTGCRDKNGASVTLSTCLAAAAYSSDFTFATDRVISK